MCSEHHYVLPIVQLYENSICLISISYISKTCIDNFLKFDKAADRNVTSLWYRQYIYFSYRFVNISGGFDYYPL